jgi:hypothetical protein
MKFKLCLIATTLLTTAQLSSSGSEAVVVDGSDLRKQETEKEAQIHKLSIDEQLKLRAAQQKAAQDPEVIAAVEKRNKAFEEFRAALVKSMLKSDPTMQVILDKMAQGASAGY